MMGSSHVAIPAKSLIIALWIAPLSKLLVKRSSSYRLSKYGYSMLISTAMNMINGKKFSSFLSATSARFSVIGKYVITQLNAISPISSLDVLRIKLDPFLVSFSLSLRCFFSSIFSPIGIIGLTSNAPKLSFDYIWLTAPPTQTKRLPFIRSFFLSHSLHYHALHEVSSRLD